MKKLIYALTPFLILCCSQPKVNKTSRISEKDSLYLEKELRNYKNMLFYELYIKAQKETYLRNNVDPNEFCYDKIKKWDRTKSYYVSQEFDLRLYIEDTLKEKLVKKWLNKKRYIPELHSPEYKDGSMDMVRALDFYNSDDLAQHIDSLRQIKYKRLLDGEENISN